MCFGAKIYLHIISAVRMPCHLGETSQICNPESVGRRTIGELSLESQLACRCTSDTLSQKVVYHSITLLTVLAINAGAISMSSALVDYFAKLAR